MELDQHFSEQKRVSRKTATTLSEVLTERRRFITAFDTVARLPVYVFSANGRDCKSQPRTQTHARLWIARARKLSRITHPS